MCAERTRVAPKSIEPTSQASSTSFGRRGESAGVRLFPVFSRSRDRTRSFASRDSSISNRRRIRWKSVSGVSPSLTSRCSTSTS